MAGHSYEVYLFLLLFFIHPIILFCFWTSFPINLFPIIVKKHRAYFFLDKRGGRWTGREERHNIKAEKLKCLKKYLSIPLWKKLISSPDLSVFKVGPFIIMRKCRSQGLLYTQTLSFWILGSSFTKIELSTPFSSKSKTCISTLLHGWPWMWVMKMKDNKDGNFGWKILAHVYLSLYSYSIIISLYHRWENRFVWNKVANARIYSGQICVKNHNFLSSQGAILSRIWCSLTNNPTLQLTHLQQ